VGFEAPDEFGCGGVKLFVEVQHYFVSHFGDGVNWVVGFFIIMPMSLIALMVGRLGNAFAKLESG
jgi:hypothetical protein